MTCCREAPRPKPWTAGVDDSADPRMIAGMERVAAKISNETPLEEFIAMCRASVNFDSRTRLGGDLQRCLLHGAADRLDLLAHAKNPRPWATARDRMRDAWSVFRGRSVALALKH